MKRSSIAIATGIGVACLSLWSCDSQDPSARRENEKTLAEATSKIVRLEQQIDDLKSENESLVQKAASSESKMDNGLTEAQLDTKIKPLTEQIASITEKLDNVIAQNETKRKDAQADTTPPPKETTRQQTTTDPVNPNKDKVLKFDKPIMGPGSQK